MAHWYSLVTLKREHGSSTLEPHSRRALYSAAKSALASCHQKHGTVHLLKLKEFHKYRHPQMFFVERRLLRFGPLQDHTRQSTLCCFFIFYAVYLAISGQMSVNVKRKYTQTTFAEVLSSPHDSANSLFWLELSYKKFVTHDVQLPGFLIYTSNA